MDIPPCLPNITEAGRQSNQSHIICDLLQSEQLLTVGVVQPRGGLGVGRHAEYLLVGEWPVCAISVPTSYSTACIAAVLHRNPSCTEAISWLSRQWPRFEGAGFIVRLGLGLRTVLEMPAASDGGPMVPRHWHWSGNKLPYGCLGWH